MSKSSAPALTASEAERVDLRTSLQPLVDIARRIPWTASVLVVMVVLGVVTGGLWSALHVTPWWDRLAYGVPALQAGHWWSPVTGSLVAALPSQYLTLLVFYGITSGFCEWRIGTRRTVLACVAGQLVGVLGTIAIAAALADSGSDWGRGLGNQNYSGFWAGSMCALVVVGSTLRAPWRARVLVGSVGFNIITLVWVGLFWDVNRMIATIVGLALVLPQTRDLLVRDRRMSPARGPGHGHRVPRAHRLRPGARDGLPR